MLRRSRLAKIGRLVMEYVPRDIVKKGAGRPLPAARSPKSIAGDQVVGMPVQLPLDVPKSAVAELQVQPWYQLSLASRTAPT